jgi:hypothetical protein
MKNHIRADAYEMVCDLKEEIISRAIHFTIFDTFYQVGAFIGLSYFVDSKIIKIEKYANIADKPIYLTIRALLGLCTGVFSVTVIANSITSLQKYVANIRNLSYYEKYNTKTI